MAKLSAHGTEIARVEYRMTFERDRPQDEDAQYRCIVSYRSDGHILRRMICLNVHGPVGSPHASHDYGWKLWQRFKHKDAVRIKAQAHRFSVACEEAGALIDITMSGHPISA